MDQAAAWIDGLDARLRELAPVAVAVSGGVDSLTLAALAHRALPGQATMVHAISPAVPSHATARVRTLADRQGWRLEVIDAGEFRDPAYRANPADRCYYCKSHLYGAIVALGAGTVLSGTNTDDLGDYRPGLRAADENRVRHPYVELGVAKDGVRAIARALGLDAAAELPAQPCLSSRIETGLAVEADLLSLVDAVERYVRRRLRARTVRCRVRAEAVVVELDGDGLAALDDGAGDDIAGTVGDRFAAAGRPLPVRFAPYRMGSAFLHPSA